MNKDIETRDDLVLLVDRFYGKVLEDPLIGPFFKNLDFEHHKPLMVRFWSFALLDEPGYTTNVIEKHLRFRIRKEHLDRWLFLFGETIDAHFTGERAEAAKQRASWVGWTILSKMN